MKALLTGMNGTVAPVLAESLAKSGYTIAPWDRSRHPIDNPEAVRHFIRSEQPDLLCHLAMGSPDWAAWMAQVCAEQDIPLLFTSTVSVFAGSQVGPFSPDNIPLPDDDYGRYKLECEQRIRQANPNAHIVRIGWQIGTAPGGNQMVDFLDRTCKEQGQIETSTLWFPGCSFLPDTAEALCSILKTLPPGLYHVDGNPGLHFHQIASGLNQLLGHPWKVIPCKGLIQNHRMLDPRVRVHLISTRLDP